MSLKATDARGHCYLCARETGTYYQPGNTWWIWVCTWCARLLREPVKR